MVQGAPQVAGRFPELLRHVQGAAAGGLLASSSTRPTAARGFARGFSIQTVGAAADRLGRARARRRPLGHRAARVHARLQPLDDARRALRAAAARRRTASRSPTRPTGTGCRVARFDYTQCDNDRANIAYRQGDAARASGSAAGAQDVLTIDRYAHLVGGCRMGTAPEDSVVDADHRVWGVAEPVRLPTAA